MTMQVFNSDQLHYINKGKVHQLTLKNHVQEALFNNPFNANYILSSLPGMGKSYETEQALKSITNGAAPLLLRGSQNISAFTIDIATAVYRAGSQHLNIVLDDCDVLFEHKNTNITKKMFDDTRALRYGKHARGLRAFCTDEQFAAIEYFSKADKAGFEVPLNNVTFLILTNRYLHTANDVDSLDAGSNKAAKATDLYAIRRRTEYKSIEMSNLELWGYVANIVLNEQICEKVYPSISQQHKEQILTWCFANWEQVTERNLSLMEKMTRDIVRYPSNYLDIWSSNYLQAK